MALKVVPAGDERCDVHNGRRPPKYICKDCMKELGVGSSRWRGRRKTLIGAGILLVIALIALGVVLLTSGGGSQTETGPPTEAEVVDALDLSPNPSGQGWITLDGDCAVLSIQIGKPPGQPVDPAVEASNEDATVRATVEESFSQSQVACVDRISAGLREHF